MCDSNSRRRHAHIHIVSVPLTLVIVTGCVYLYILYHDIVYYRKVGVLYIWHVKMAILVLQSFSSKVVLLLIVKTRYVHACSFRQHVDVVTVVDANSTHDGQ